MEVTRQIVYKSMDSRFLGHPSKYILYLEMMESYDQDIHNRVGLPI
jgi:hypothetical protein